MGEIVLRGKYRHGRVLSQPHQASRGGVSRRRFFTHGGSGCKASLMASETFRDRAKDIIISGGPDRLEPRSRKKFPASAIRFLLAAFGRPPNPKWGEACLRFIGTEREMPHPWGRGAHLSFCEPLGRF